MVGREIGCALLACGAVCGAWWSAGEAAAQTEPPALPPRPAALRLDYEKAPGAEACPDADYFRNRVTERLRAPGEPFAPAGDARLVVRVERDAAGRFRGEREVRDADGTVRERRAMEGEDCTVVLDALALGFAMWWDTAPPAPAPAPRPRPAETPKAAPGLPPKPGAPPPRAVRAHGPGRPPARPEAVVCKVRLGGYCLLVDIYSFGFSAGALMTAGFSSDVGPGMWLAAELRPAEVFSIALEVRGLFPARSVAKEQIDLSKPIVREMELQSSNVSALLVPCLRYSYFVGCAAVSLGFNIHESVYATTGGPSVGVGPRAGLEFPFAERFAIGAFAEMLFLPVPSKVLFLEENTQFNHSVVSGFFGASFSIHLK